MLPSTSSRGPADGRTDYLGRFDKHKERYERIANDKFARGDKTLTIKHALLAIVSPSRQCVSLKRLITDVPSVWIV